MADIVSADVRSRMMAGIRGKNTKPELVLRKGLHALGFRYRLHDRHLPGKPDIVFPRYHAVVFVHGCFWHGHNCNLFKEPKTRSNFWMTKISSNKMRDAAAYQALRESGWRVCEVWECTLKGKHRLDFPSVIRTVACWLRSNGPFLSVSGRE